MSALISNGRAGLSRCQPDAAAVVNLRTLLAMVVLTALVIFSPPLFFIERYSLTPYNKPIILGLIIALAILTFHQLSVTKAVISLGFVQLAQATALLALPFIHMTYGYGFDSGYFSLSFQILAGLTLFLVLANSGRASMFAKFWVNLHLVIGLLGLAAFIAGILFNLQPLDTFLKRPYYDFGLTYTNIYYQIGSVKLIRVAGFYDEPGTFAFYMTFARKTLWDGQMEGNASARLWAHFAFHGIHGCSPALGRFLTKCSIYQVCCTVCPSSNNWIWSDGARGPRFRVQSDN